MTQFIHAILHLDPTAIVQAGGYVGIALLIFAESGLLIGIFLPGDSLLFIAGILAGSGLFSYAPLAGVAIFAAVLGDTVGYWFGARVGRALFEREDSRLFKRAYLRRTEFFYKAYGARAVVLARFMPIVRTVAPILAGIGDMRYGRFLAYNAIGGVLWGGGLVSLGYFLGSVIPDSEKYILPASLAVIALSFLPMALHVYANRRSSVPERV